MSDIGIAYAKVFMGRDFKNNSWQRWSDTRETQYSYESAVSEFALNLVKRKIYTLDEANNCLLTDFSIISRHSEVKMAMYMVRHLITV